MREINKTIYDILKLEGPDDDISVTQLITDEVVKKSSEVEVQEKSVGEATGLLDIKAMNLQNAEEEKKEGTNTGIRRQIKASGKKTGATQTNIKIKQGKVAKKAVKKTGKKVTKKAGVKTGAKKVVKNTKKAPAQDSSQIIRLLFLGALIAGAVYFYLNNM